MKNFYAAVLPGSIKNKALALVLANFTLVLAGRSQTAGNWDFSNTLSGTAGSNITIGAVSLGPSIVSGAFNGGTEYFGEGGWPTGALDPNAYTQFTLTANSGYYLVLNSINLVQRRSTTGTAAGSGPNQWSLRSSLDNYATNITSGSITTSYATYTVSLPAAFQAIPSTVTFRIYGYNTTVSSGGTSRFVYDNISVQGQSVSGVLAQQSISLTARAGTNEISLLWQTEGFAAGTDLTLERSVDGAGFTPVDRQRLSANNTIFQYEEVAVSVTLFYRVSASQQDGTIFYSPVVTIKQDPAKTTQIKEVLAQGTSVKTFLHIGETGNYQLSIWSLDGRILSRRMVQENAGDPVTDIAFGAYPHGVYILTVAKGGVNDSRQFVY